MKVRIPFITKPLRSAFLLLTLGLLQGCLTTGANFPSDLHWINAQKTNQKDVSLLLGRPFSVGNSGGDPTWTYAYYSYNLFGTSFYKELKFYWDKDKSVKHFSFTSSFPEDVNKDDGAGSVATKIDPNKSSY